MISGRLEILVPPEKKRKPDFPPALKVLQSAANIALWSFFVNFFLKSFYGNFGKQGDPGRVE
jgi:hypothetical protein